MKLSKVPHGCKSQRNQSAGVCGPTSNSQQEASTPNPYWEEAVSDSLLQGAANLWHIAPKN